MRKPVILCVDDEKIVLDSLKVQLETEFQNDYLYEMAESAAEALEIIEEFQEEERLVLVIVSDWLMPGIRGDEFLIQVHERFPNTVKVLLTGQADSAAVDRAIRYANLHGCLMKPWQSTELIATIRSGLEKI